MNEIYLRDLADGVVRDAVLTSMSQDLRNHVFKDEDPYEIVVGQYFDGAKIDQLNKGYAKESKNKINSILNEAEDVLKKAEKYAVLDDLAEYGVFDNKQDAQEYMDDIKLSDEYDPEYAGKLRIVTKTVTESTVPKYRIGDRVQFMGGSSAGAIGNVTNRGTEWIESSLDKEKLMRSNRVVRMLNEAEKLIGSPDIDPKYIHGTPDSDLADVEGQAFCVRLGISDEESEMMASTFGTLGPKAVDVLVKQYPNIPKQKIQAFGKYFEYL